MIEVLVTGANGQLGQSLRARASRYPRFSFHFTDVETLDLCDAEAVRDFVVGHGVDYILNCAAYTAVDKAESEEPLCGRINGEAVRNVGQAAQAVGAKVIHVSTDYVFDGTNCRPYVETDPTCPISAYGRTKLAGEEALLACCPNSVVLRTAWLYSEYGHNFVKTMLRLGAEREELRVIFDQVGTPTYAGDLADMMLSIVEQAEQGHFEAGVFHFSNEGVCSWYDFTVKILQLAGLRARVIPIETKDYPTAAARPHYSVLNKAKVKAAYGVVIPHWEASLRSMIDRL